MQNIQKQVWIGVDEIFGALFSGKVPFLANIRHCSNFLDRYALLQSKLRFVKNIGIRMDISVENIIKEMTKSFCPHFSLNSAYI